MIYIKEVLKRIHKRIQTLNMNKQYAKREKKRKSLT